MLILVFINFRENEVEKQGIPYLKALIIGILNPEDQERGNIIGLPRSLFVKNVLFRRRGRDKLLMLPRPCPSGFSLNLMKTKISILGVPQQSSVSVCLNDTKVKCLIPCIHMQKEEGIHLFMFSDILYFNTISTVWTVNSFFQFL